MNDPSFWGVAPNPTKNFLGRKFLEFKELSTGDLFDVLKIFCDSLAASAAQRVAEDVDPYKK